MNQYSLWRYLLLISLIVLGVVYALPNLYGEDPAIQVSSKQSAALPEDLSDNVKKGLVSQHIPVLSVTHTADNILIRFNNTEDQLKAQDVIEAIMGGDYSVALNLAPRTPKWLQSLGAQPMKLGLDLRGGIHFLLDVDVDAMISARESSDIHSIASDLRDKKIRYTAITPQGKQGITVVFRDVNAQEQALVRLKARFPEYTLTTFEQAGKPALKAVISQDELVKLANYAVDQNIATLRNRVNELGVAEPVIQRQGAQQISVDLPGIQDTARAKDMIGKVATIRLQLEDLEHSPESAKQTGIVPFGSKLYTYEGRSVLLKNQVVLKGTSIINAASIMGDNGRPAVSVRVGGSGESMFNRITAQNIGKPLAVVYVETEVEKQIKKGKVVTQHRQVEKIINIATIQSALGNHFQITGLESMQYAKNLALLLRSGAYSAPVDFVQERVVGPSLGKKNIHMGVLSTEIGSLLVIFFMALYYRVFGLVANAALVLNIVFIVAVLSILGATLTLPSIAGIVLTVGMAVDANVLINERIREELRNGMSPQASIHAGYDRAYSTIVDANITTLIVALVLFALGSGSVQGFAVTLSIGLVTSMLTAIFFTRAVINLMYGHRNMTQLPIGIQVSKTSKLGKV